MGCLAIGILFAYDSDDIGSFDSEKVFRYFDDLSGSYCRIELVSTILHGGNYTEEFAIPFQVACVYLIMRFERHKKTGMALACGASLGMLFFLRQNLISVGLAIIIFYALRATRSRLPTRELFSILSGFGIVSAGFMVYLASQSDLKNFWEAAFIYNFNYTNLGFLERLKAVISVLSFIFKNPLFLIQFAAWLLAVWNLIRYYSSSLVNLLKKQWLGWTLFGGGMLSFLAVFIGEYSAHAQTGIGYGQRILIVFGVILLITSMILLIRQYQVRGMFQNLGSGRGVALHPARTPKFRLPRLYRQ